MRLSNGCASHGSARSDPSRGPPRGTAAVPGRDGGGSPRGGGEHGENTLRACSGTCGALPRFVTPVDGRKILELLPAMRTPVFEDGHNDPPPLRKHILYHTGWDLRPPSGDGNGQRSFRSPRERCPESAHSPRGGGQLLHTAHEEGERGAKHFLVRSRILTAPGGAGPGIAWKRYASSRYPEEPKSC